jgi:hypothetical protein
MVGDVIAEIPKENPVVRLTENWLDVGYSKFVGIAASLMIIVFDEIAYTDVSLLCVIREISFIKIDFFVVSIIGATMEGNFIIFFSFIIWIAPDRIIWM